MKRKDFIKKTAFAMATASFVAWDLFASNEVDFNDLLFSKSIQRNGYSIYMGANFSFESKKSDIVSINFSKKLPIEDNIEFKFEYLLLENLKLDKRIKVMYLGDDTPYEELLNEHSLDQKYLLKINQLMVSGEHSLTEYKKKNLQGFVSGGHFEFLIGSINPNKNQNTNAITANILANERSIFSDDESDDTNSSESTSSDDHIYYFSRITDKLENETYFHIYFQISSSLKKGDTIDLVYYNTSSKARPKYDKDSILYEFTYTYELTENFLLSKNIKIKQKGDPVFKFSPSIKESPDFDSSMYLEDSKIFAINEFSIESPKINEYDYKEVFIGNYSGKEKLHIEETYTTPSTCYLTSACVQHLGLPDDCIELTTLRKFRDGYMKSSKEGRAMIEKYYLVAPGILNHIQQQTHKSKIYQFIYDGLVLPSLNMIENGEKEKAMQYYASFTKILQQKCNV